MAEEKIPSRDITYEILREGEDNTLKLEYENYPKVPSIEDDEVVMAKAIELLIENSGTTKIVFRQKREYEYDYTQTQVLIEIAKLYNRLIKQTDVFNYQNFNQPGSKHAPRFYAELHNLFLTLLRRDPVGAYVQLKRSLRREHINQEKTVDEQEYQELGRYIKVISYLLSELENTKLITLTKPYLAGHVVGNREVYRKVFAPSIKPDFMFTRIMAMYPPSGVELANYNVGDTEVVIFEIPDTIQYLYHITPPEFKLTEDKYELLDDARKIMAEHKPERQEFIDPTRIREVFFNIGHDLIDELSTNRNIKLNEDELKSLTQILVRYTVGFGLIEILLEDPHIQDVTMNSPPGQIPLFLVHSEFGDCKTNIVPSITDSESFATKLRLTSGRPLDEANPILDTEIEIPGIASARVGVISPPLNPFGIAFAFRRHRDKPWTLPLFINNQMITPLAAGPISFRVDGNRTLLGAGTRSAGKSSLLGSLLVEIMRRYRIITIEDTLELPTTPLRKLGYNIQSMKVASALSKGSSEVPADEGIRTTLRLGDSALFVGEVRSTEAKALYESMRVGALANVVAGTIHGDSPYGVFDRVVNDLGVPRTSFKATDIIIVANPVRSADGLHRYRRVTQITEVRKQWQDDPLAEKGFVDLMKYNAKTDQLEPTDELVNGESEIVKAIAGSVREWAGNWDAVWENILLRAQIKETITQAAHDLKNDDILEAACVIQCNDMFHRFSDKVKEKYGKLDPKHIFMEWNEWFQVELKKYKK